MDGKSEKNRPTLILFSLRERTRRFGGGDKSAEWIVCPRCFTGVWGKTMWQHGEGGVGSGVLASFEKMKMRPPDAGKSVDKAGRQTFDGEQPPVWLEEKLQKESIDPSPLRSPLPASLEDVSDLLILGIMESLRRNESVFFSSSFARIYDTKPSHAVFLKRWITWTLPSFVSFIRLTYCFFLRKNGIYIYIFFFNSFNAAPKIEEMDINLFRSRDESQPSQAYKLDKIMFYFWTYTKI